MTSPRHSHVGWSTHGLRQHAMHQTWRVRPPQHRGCSAPDGGSTTFAPSPSCHAGDGCVSARCKRTTRRPADRALESYGTPPNGWRPGAGWGCPLVQVPVYCGAQVHGETPPQEGGVGRSTGPGMASSLSWIQQRGTGSCSSPISEWQHHPGKVTVDRQRMNGANRPCTRRPWRWITSPTVLCRVGSAHRRHR